MLLNQRRLLSYSHPYATDRITFASPLFQRVGHASTQSSLSLNPCERDDASLLALLIALCALKVGLQPLLSLPRLSQFNLQIHLAPDSPTEGFPCNNNQITQRFI